MRPASPHERRSIDPLLGKPGSARAAAASEKRHRHLPRPHGRAGWAVITIVVALAALAVADQLLGPGDEVAPNVVLAGEPVGELGRPELDARIGAVAERFGSTPVTVRSDVGAVATTAGELGLAVDPEASAQAAWDANRSDVPLVGWAVMAARSVEVPARLTTAGWRGEQVLGTGPVAAEAQLEVRDGVLMAVGGVPTLGIDPGVVRTQLEAMRWAGGPIEIAVPAATAVPARTAAEVQAVADRVNAATQGPLTVEAGGATTALEPDLVRSWVRLAPAPEGFSLDPDQVTATLSERFADRSSAPDDARFEVQGGQPVIVGGTAGVSCCSIDAVAPLTAALAAGVAASAPVVVPVVVEEPAVAAADLEALGVVEPVGAFTTRFPCCQPRVTNIRRMAELLDGQLIGPGETFSVNDEIGPRTPEKGFVAAPAIVEGKIGEELGGGISQVMTTLFNAAFFAGLDFGQYQSHSLYFDRYPYGREATLSWPGPDLELENTTGHGVVIVTSVGDTSITITMWSTKIYASVSQTGQSEGVSGVSCTLVTTERTRVGVDGETEVDAVRAIYRREEGLNCDQAELPPTTTVPPPTTAGPTTVPPEPPATTAPTTLPEIVPTVPTTPADD